MQKRTNGNLWLILMMGATLAAGAFAAGANQGLGDQGGEITGIASAQGSTVLLSAVDDPSFKQTRVANLHGDFFFFDLPFQRYSVCDAGNCVEVNLSSRDKQGYIDFR